LDWGSVRRSALWEEKFGLDSSNFEVLVLGHVVG